MNKKFILIVFQIVGTFLLLYCSNLIKSYIKPELNFEYNPFLLAFIINIPFYFIGILLGINNILEQFPYREQWRINIPILLFTILGIAFILSYQFIFYFIPFTLVGFLLNAKSIITLNILIGYIFISHIVKINSFEKSR